LDEVRLEDIAPPELAGGGEPAFERALLELAGEAGDLAKRFAGGDHRDNPDALRGDLIKLLRPLGRASVAAEVSLDEAGRQNIAKTESRWPIEEKFPPLFDDGYTPTSSSLGSFGWRSSSEMSAIRHLYSRSATGYSSAIV
jgi:hypothetical protein